jgi:hypothetical protein
MFLDSNFEPFRILFLDGKLTRHSTSSIRHSLKAAIHNVMPPPRRCVAVFLAALVVLAMHLVACQKPVHPDPRATRWPSLKFQFVSKRSSMKVYGQSNLSMEAAPVVGNGRVQYNVFAQFTQSSATYNYTEVNGTTYLSTSSVHNSSAASLVECLQPSSSNIPSINSIVSAINEATEMLGRSSALECSTGRLFKVTVTGIDFALCSQASGLSMNGADLDVFVEYLEKPVDVVDPLVTARTRSECPSASSWSSLTPIGTSLLTGAPVAQDETRKLAAAFDFSLGESCRCKSKLRPCVFVHGLGIKKEYDGNRDRFYYWGDLEGHAPCCSSMEYTYLNTSGNPWTSDSLQQKVCDRVLEVSATSSDSTIADTIVVTHSMGNLMLAGAIATGKCSLASSSSWVGLAGPMKGSMCSDFIQDSCAGKSTAVLETVAEVTGTCPPTTGVKSLPVQGGKYSSAKLDAAYQAAQKAYRANVYAVMCGEKNVGLVSLYQPVFWMLGKMVPHTSKRNDGMVEFESCAAGFPEAKFGDSYRDRFYRTKLNHVDMEFISGDAMLDEAKMPVKWFECLL